MAFYQKKAKREHVSVASLVTDDLLQLHDFAAAGECDGELEEEANSPEMEKLRAKFGILTKKKADEISEKTRNDPTRPRFKTHEEMLGHLHGLVKG
jgi:hypothetical protein